MPKYFFLLLLSSQLYADEGCQAIIDNKTQECKADNLLEKERTDSSLSASVVSQKLSDSTIKISETLSSIDVSHLGEEMSIERSASKEAPSCPPFCIQPMRIEGIKTVAELETLAFIKDLKKKKSQLIIDVRKSKAYKEETIPGAINLPYTMLIDGSPYQKEVLKLLGSGKKLKKKWFFKHPHQLLIFGNSSFSPEAFDAITQLIKLGYPKDKILYYRGGVKAWKASGLTLI